MMKVSLREFANLTEDVILRWMGFRIAVEVVDDFGESLKTDTYNLMISWYGLNIHRHWNKEKYSIDEIIQTAVYNDNSLATPVNNFLARIMPTMYDPVDTDLVKRLLFAWQAKLNNFLVAFTETSAVSATAECVLEMMDDPGIKEIKEKILNNEITIDEGEGLFIDYVKTAPSLDFNIFTLLARTGGVSYNQAYQQAVMRGAVFDLNNQILPNAITNSYGEGITNLADSLGDSRSAGKALLSNGKALQDSEWFHRKIHLLLAPVIAINHHEDCGSPFLIPSKIDNRAKAIALEGKYMKGEDGNLVLITPAVAKKLTVGETIEIRSIKFCLNHDANTPCRTCYGMMKQAIPYNVIMKRDANVGMFAGTTICNPIGQSLLSTKHFLRNTVTQPFVVDRLDEDVISTNGDDIFIHKKLCCKGTKLVLHNGIVRELSDFRMLDSLDNISQDKMSFFNEVRLEYLIEDPMVGGETVFQKSVRTSVSTRSARLSMDLLEYVLEKGWETHDRKNVSIDLSDWNNKSPLFNLPYMHEDLNVHRERIENFLVFSKRNKVWREQVVSPKLFGQTLDEFWSLINHKFKGNNIVYPEIMLMAVTAANPEQGDYSLKNGDKESYFTSFHQCVGNRGSGTIFIFDNQQGILNKPSSFDVVNRQPSPLECYWRLGTT